MPAVRDAGTWKVATHQSAKPADETSASSAASDQQNFTGDVPLGQGLRLSKLTTWEARGSSAQNSNKAPAEVQNSAAR